MTKTEFLESYDKTHRLLAQIDMLKAEHRRLFDAMAIPVDLFFRDCTMRISDMTVLVHSATRPAIPYTPPHTGFMLIKKPNTGTNFVAVPSTHEGIGRIWLRDINPSKRGEMNIRSVNPEYIEIEFTDFMSDNAAGSDVKKAMLFHLPLDFVLDSESHFETFRTFERDLMERDADLAITREMLKAHDLSALTALIRAHPKAAQDILKSITP